MAEVVGGKDMILQWYDRLAISGIIIAFVGFMMFVVGLGNMLNANRQAGAEFKQAQQDLRK